MSGFMVRCRIPLADLGQLQFPRRVRYADGFVRLGADRSRQQLIATLEDKEGAAIPAATYIEACAKAMRMGQALCIRLLEHNRAFTPGAPA